VRGPAVALSADATDNAGVNWVYFLVKGNVVGTDTTAPYGISWDSKTVADGWVGITALAFDASNNQGTAAVRSVLVDNVYPNTFIDSGPATRTKSTKASIRFSSPDPDVTGFRCSLDGKAYKSCSSPKTYTGLSAGKHVFRVKAVGSAGAAIDSDPTPATGTWTVLRRR
jgi:hypothetical protein